MYWTDYQDQDHPHQVQLGYVLTSLLILMSLVRPPYAWDTAPAVQQPDLLRTTYITICHLRYPEGGYQAHIIAQLPVFDKISQPDAAIGSSSGSNGGQWGLPESRARIMGSQILAWNSQGFLSTTRHLIK